MKGGGDVRGGGGEKGEESESRRPAIEWGREGDMVQAGLEVGGVSGGAGREEVRSCIDD